MNHGLITNVFRSQMRDRVLEREILRVVATVQGSSPAAVMDAVRREVLNWVQNRSGGKLPSKARDGQSFEFQAGGRNIRGVGIDDEDSTLWALRGDDPDKTVPGRIWTTEIVLDRKGDDQPQFSLRLLVGTPEAELNIDLHVPGVLQQIVSACGLNVGPFPLRTQAWLIETKADIDNLIDLLTSEHRRLPVLVVSGSEDARFGEPFASLVNADELAKATLGIAHVVALPARQTFSLSEAVGKVRSTFQGAIRTYLPGFHLTSDPYQHRLFFADRINRDPKGTVSEIKEIVARESLRGTRIGREVIPFAQVRSAALRIDQEKRSKERTSDSDQITSLQERIKAQEDEIEGLKADANQALELATSEEERAKLAESRSYAFQSQIDSLRDKLSEQGLDPDDGLVFPEKWSDFAEWVDKNFVGRCVIVPSARNNVRSGPEFRDVALVGRCIRWLAKTCRSRRIEGGGQLSNAPIEEGVQNAPCGSDSFDFSFQGRRLHADWHVKTGGNTRDPSRCLRIYYAFDEMKQEIVIADMPAHRKTEAS